MYLSAQSALRAFVARLAALSPLSQQDIAALKALPAQVARIRSNTDIVVPGADFEHAVLVASGLVGRFHQLADGRRQIIAIHVSGELADLHCLATPRAASALQALTNVAIVRIPANELRSLASASPAITQAFWTYSAVDAAIVARWATNLGRRDARSRMAHLLCEFGLRVECAGQGTRSEFLLELTQSQLGEALGLTAVHVNRTLRALKEIGVLRTEGRIFHIPNWPRLAAIADFESDYLQLLQPAVAAA